MEKRVCQWLWRLCLHAAKIQVPVQAKEAEGWIRKNVLTAVEKLNPEAKTEGAQLTAQDKNN